MGGDRTVTGLGSHHIALASVLALGALLLGVTPALANGGYVETTTPIGAGPGEEAGHLDLAAPSRVEQGVGSAPTFDIGGSGITVDDQTHDLYVADTNNHRISEFEANGTFLRTFGKGVNKTNALEPNVCKALEECQKGAEGSAPGELQAPRFIAVDNSTTSPSKGDVYVGDGVGTQAVNELQSVSFGGASEVTYTLTLDYNGKQETTKSIVYTNVPPPPGSNLEGPDAQAAQQALEELANIGSGNVRVREIAAETSTEPVGLIINFDGALAETPLPALGCDSSSLTPAGSCAMKVEREGSNFVGEVISKFTAEGVLVESWGDTGQLDGQLTGRNASEGPFGGKLEGLAVDPSGDLFVLDENKLDEFDQAGVLAESDGAPGRIGPVGVRARGRWRRRRLCRPERDAVEKYGPGGQQLATGVGGARSAPDRAGVGCGDGGCGSRLG